MSARWPTPKWNGRSEGPGFWQRLSAGRFGSIQLVEPAIYLVRLVCWLIYVAARAIFHSPQ